MKHYIFPKLLLVPTLFLFVACAGQQQKPHMDAMQACWLEQPVKKDNFGQFGLARDIYIGGETPKTKSRKRALASIADYLSIENGLDSVLEQVNDETESIQLKGKTVYFNDDVSVDGYIHSLASLKAEKQTEQCLPQSCDISACQPRWLCSPSIEGETAVLGVSYHATSPVEQHYKSIGNALLQAEYMYGVDIVASKDLRQTNSDYFRYNILLQDGKVDTGAKETLSYAVTDRCYSNGTLFSRVALYGDALKSNSETISDHAWLSNPKHLGYDGAVGAAQRNVASGLISDQIKLAIKRAAFQLAFEKESNVSEELLLIQYQSNNSLTVSYIKENTNVELKAKVLSIHFKETADEQLEVYAWLAAID